MLVDLMYGKLWAVPWTWNPSLWRLSLGFEFLPSPFILSVMAPISSSTLRQPETVGFCPCQTYLPGEGCFSRHDCLYVWEGLGMKFPHDFFASFKNLVMHLWLKQTLVRLQAEGLRCGLQTKNDGVCFPVLPLSSCIGLEVRLHVPYSVSVCEVREESGIHSMGLLWRTG